MKTESTSRPLASRTIRAGLSLLLAAVTVLATVGCGGSRDPSGNDLVVSGSASAASFRPGAAAFRPRGSGLESRQAGSAASNCADVVRQPTIAPWALIISNVACLKAGK